VSSSVCVDVYDDGLTSEVGSDVVAFGAGDGTVCPAAGQAQVAGALAADVIGAEVRIQRLGVGEYAAARAPAAHGVLRGRRARGRVSGHGRDGALVVRRRRRERGGRHGQLLVDVCGDGGGSCRRGAVAVSLLGTRAFQRFDRGEALLQLLQRN
jgi:hypothetical protein